MQTQMQSPLPFRKTPRNTRTSCDLLAITHINKNDLPRLLREYAHAENVNDYLNRLRVRHALKLMKEKPHFSIMAIGEEAGFRSRATFYRAFLKECGMTPTQYLQAHQ